MELKLFIINPAMIEYLKGAKAIKPMSEQSYRNWKSKGFKGYEIPNLDNIIEANRSEDDA